MESGRDGTGQAHWGTLKDLDKAGAALCFRGKLHPNRSRRRQLVNTAPTLINIVSPTEILKISMSRHQLRLINPLNSGGWAQASVNFFKFSRRLHCATQDWKSLVRKERGPFPTYCNKGPSSQLIRKLRQVTQINMREGNPGNSLLYFISLGLEFCQVSILSVLVPSGLWKGS